MQKDVPTILPVNHREAKYAQRQKKKIWDSSLQRSIPSATQQKPTSLLRPMLFLRPFTINTPGKGHSGQHLVAISTPLYQKLHHRRF